MDGEEAARAGRAPHFDAAAVRLHDDGNVITGRLAKSRVRNRRSRLNKSALEWTQSRLRRRLPPPGASRQRMIIALG
jgi:hypothetical protein